MKLSQFLKILVLPLALLAYSASSLATWYVANGSAAIVDGATAARNEAVNDAIRNALLQAGANVQIEQSYKNGVLLSDRVNLKSQTPIRQVVVVEEQRTLNRISVTVKVLLDDKRISQCSAGKVHRTMVPVSFRFIDSQAFQGSVGIENIAKELDKALYEKLSNMSVFKLTPVANINIAPRNDVYAGTNQDMDNITTIANRYGTQYVMIASINSVSVSEPNDNFLTKMIFIPSRSVNFDIDIYDAVNRMQVFHQNYSGEADWPFKNNEYLDLRSDRFKGSAYAQRINDLISRASSDLMAKFQCAPVSARVIATEGDDIIINLGRESAIAKDMEFSLEQTSSMPSGLGGEYDVYEHKNVSYKVVAVYPRAAKLHPTDLDHNILNVNINDVVTLN